MGSGTLTFEVDDMVQVLPSQNALAWIADIGCNDVVGVTYDVIYVTTGRRGTFTPDELRPFADRRHADTDRRRVP